jgi:ATP-dependent DNA ligase I
MSGHRLSPSGTAAGADCDNCPVLLAEIVSTSAAVASTSARRAKIDEIAALLVRVPADEIPIAVAFLSGDLTQRQIGVGYAALIGLPEAREAVASAATPARPAAAASLTLAETDVSFGQIGMLTGAGSQARRRELLARLMGRTTESERQFLFRLLAGDLRQGALEGVMIDAVAKATGAPAAEVRRAHQLRGSLPEVARAALEAARGPDQNGERVAEVLRAFTLRVGQPVRPMLAASAPTLDAALARISPAALDWKIDGIRIQIHRDGPHVRVFTRTLDDITERVPEIVAMASTLNVRTAVVDGEAVALRPDGRPYPFQVISARVASLPGMAQNGPTASVPTTGPRAPVPLTALLFDLLHLDGRDLIDEPAAERFARLTEIAPPDALIPRIVTADLEQAGRFFDDAIARGHEGVVVKAVDSPYGAGRRGSDWIKVKPRTTLDLVILAAEWGHGRRTGWLSNLHLGARDPETGGFVMLGKTFKGLTDAMLTWQTERLLALADGEQAASARPFGVVRVRPELVAEIAFDGVQASRRYPGGVALRFARVLRYREDKTASEADTIATVRALWPHGEDESEGES